MQIEVDGEMLAIRPGLAAAIEEAWQRLARPGTWWTGAERLAIADEVRRARTCALCRRRKSALSPYAPGVGTMYDRAGHDHAGRLPLDAVEAVHRLATDAGRITESWIRGCADGPLGEERYVEIVTLVAIVSGLDTLERALGRPLQALPPAVAGAPSRHRPRGARRDLAAVTTLAPETVEAGDPNPFPLHGDKNIHRAASLVPQGVIDFFDLDVELYLRDHEIRDFAHEHRAITHRQIELIAARASVLNRCHY